MLGCIVEDCAGGADPIKRRMCWPSKELISIRKSDPTNTCGGFVMEGCSQLNFGGLKRFSLAESGLTVGTVC